MSPFLPKSNVLTNINKTHQHQISLKPFQQSSTCYMQTHKYMAKVKGIFLQFLVADMLEKLFRNSDGPR
jgi:hypothetical protein